MTENADAGMDGLKQCCICGLHYAHAEFDFGRGRIRAECKRCVNKLGQIRRNRGLQKMREWRNQTVREWNPSKRKKRKKKKRRNAASGDAGPPPPSSAAAEEN